MSKYLRNGKSYDWLNRKKRKQSMEILNAMPLVSEVSTLEIYRTQASPATILPSTLEQMYLKDTTS